MLDMSKLLEENPVVPLIQTNEPKIAVEISRALAAGGLSVVEVVLRTDRALECLQAITDELPDVTASAGTVLNAAEAEAALAHGAKFIISPGLDDGVFEVASSHDVPLYAGIMTPGELQHAYNLGLDTVKFFPAEIAGGVPALEALSSVFRTMRFMPTGGVSPDNLADYLAVPAVVACGGKWLTPSDAIDAGNYDEITKLAAAALDIASRAIATGAEA